MKPGHQIKNFFYPSSICIAGASTKEKSIGYELLKTIRSFGYTGKIFPVNPKADSILGFECFKKIEDIPDKIDLAIVAVPKAFVEDSIDSIIRKGTSSIILITAGFKETGAEGEELEKIISDKIKSAGARFVGPNCMGVINSLDAVKLNATFVAEKPEKGRTAFLSQSGAIGAAVLNSLRETDIRFAHFISVGNKADVSENDLVDFWQSDENISLMTLYLESFKDGESLLKKFAAAKVSKPVIILKAGRTEAGIKAASSHTGALGSSDKAADAVLDQFGIIRAENLNELFNTAKGFENFPLPNGNKIAVVTNAGGPAILAVDAVGNENLLMAKFSEKTKERLKEIVHPEGSVNNPVDLLPGGSAEQFKKVNEIVSADENVDAVISIFVEPVMVQPFEVVENINSIESEKPVYQVVMPLPEFWENYRINSSAKKPLFRNPEDPAKVISDILFYKRKSKRKNFLEPGEVKSNFGNKNEFVSAALIKQIGDRYKLPFVQSHYVRYESLGDFADRINYPAVIKGISKDVIHKSELNAVRTDIKNFDDLLSAAKSIKENFTKNKIELESLLIQPFVKPKFELLIGGYRDSSFGPMIMFGGGGKYVEVYDDTCLKSAYLSEEDLDEIIERTKIGKILKGVRGESPVDIEQIKRVIKSSAQMMLDNQNISEFDFNPLIVGEDELLNIVDARIKLK